MPKGAARGHPRPDGRFTLAVTTKRRAGRRPAAASEQTSHRLGSGARISTARGPTDRSMSEAAAAGRRGSWVRHLRRADLGPSANRELPDCSSGAIRAWSCVCVEAGLASWSIRSRKVSRQNRQRLFGARVRRSVVWTAFGVSLVLVLLPFWAMAFLATRHGVDLSGPRAREVRYDVPYLRVSEHLLAVWVSGAVLGPRLARNSGVRRQWDVSDTSLLTVWEAFDEPGAVSGADRTTPERRHRAPVW